MVDEINSDRLFVAGCQLCCYLQFTTDNKIFIKGILVSEPKVTQN